VRSLLAWPALGRLDVAQRRALGITAMLAADLTKKANGKAGMFSPTRPA
jgi:hypothetical protein